MSVWDKIRYYGDPILAQRSEEIEGEPDPEMVAELLEVATSDRANGISAVQLGYLVRAFCVSVDDWKENGTRIKGTPQLYINPKLSDPEGEMLVMEEGCLSIPGLYVPVERPRTIVVEALDEKGNPFRQELEDFQARVIMHENDHLNGVLTINRLPKSLRNRFEPQLRRIKKRWGKR